MKFNNSIPGICSTVHPTAFKIISNGDGTSSDHG